MATQRYDAIVVGAGQGGGPLAGALAKAGKRTALIEREHYGGTCVNVGCTPTKTMVASARVAYLARRAADYGVRTGEVSVDLAQVRARKRAIVDSFRSGSEERARGTDGLDAIDAEAHFVGERELAIRTRDGGEHTATADWIFLNVGCRPAVPKVEGLERVPFVDSTSIMELDAVPEHLVVLGGGYIGVEFAQMFRRFGARVTVLVRGQSLLAREDPDVTEALAEVLAQDGVELRFGTELTRAAGEAGTLRLTTSQGDALNASQLLVATGRRPNTDWLDPAAGGVATDQRGFIPTDARLATGVDGVWALGDVRGGPAFTHISYDDYRILVANLLEDGDRTVDDRLVPYTVFTDPQLGRVGLSERDATEKGHDIRVATMPMSWVARALEMDEPRGLLKAVVDARTDRILGAAVLGIEGGELMAALQIAMLGGVPYQVLRDGIFAHPTLAESLNNLFGNFR